MSEQARHKAAMLRRCRRVVVKIGSSILSGTAGIHRERLERISVELDAIASGPRELVVVSSGAVAAGVARLGWKRRPKAMPEKQAAAAVGQITLMALYQDAFARLGRNVAQILLTHDDLTDRRRYLNARHTFEAALRADVVPIVNENDTVVVEEMKRNFGDNDNLSALVATLIGADLLVILSDVAGLYTANPRNDPEARLVPVVESITARIRESVGGPGSEVGTGGMATKLNAAHKAGQAGIPCIIADGLREGVLARVFDPAVDEGTLFLPTGDRLARRKHWIAHTLRPAGTLRLDEGAYEAVTRRGRSLLARGIVEVAGKFGNGECVSCLTPDGVEFARGLVGYGSAELEKIRGLHSSAIEGALGYKLSDEVVHRNDLVLLD